VQVGDRVEYLARRNSRARECILAVLAGPHEDAPQAGIDRDRRVIAYCGGGISATIDLFLLHQLGFDDLTLYDGSMGEWAKDPSLPIETG